MDDKELNGEPLMNFKINCQCEYRKRYLSILPGVPNWKELYRRGLFSLETTELSPMLFYLQQLI